MSGACVLCGGPRGDKEHGFPKWLQRWWNPSREHVDTVLPDGRKIRDGGWNLAVVKAMCTECNQWMGLRWEDRVAPLLKQMNTGTPMILTARDQRWLAGWAYKTALMIECSAGDRHSVNPQALRRFRSSGEPPPKESIVLGVSVGSFVAYHRNHFQLAVGGQSVSGYAAFLCASQTFFHIIGDTDRPYGHEFLAPDQYRIGLEPIWPRQSRPLHWPLGHGWEPGALENLATFGGNRFRFLE